ncbi:hypothetical protein TCAL_05004 [Tigriopus californicus]|uniref:Uncharacterized protein n=1 Tax=Tigriopus californicus TaxID=6832 RepID=A0A553PMN4_TIGCA|nr:uncharacterized protein LOC131889850 [Tigriopus californicus]TRY78948.1 hypothetical protein TCAL_05004 [Tigriopus californicus]|eukprot:TCALIF_05004-PA protein Name:"Similar to KLHL8 Kelch-like protein 8 (Homo sapiens)" AED:0.00 eAED:0.00 QI:32/1/1/1/1/1/4/735/373
MIRVVFFVSVSVLATHTLGCDPPKIENGRIECNSDEDTCLVTCDFAYITSDKIEFYCDDPGLKAVQCVRPMTILIGGESALFDALDDVELISTKAQLRDRKIAMFPYGIVAPMVFWTDGVLMACGGRRPEGRAKSYEKSCWIYEPCENEWKQTIALTQPRSNGVGVVDFRGKPLVYGGMNENETTMTSELWNTTSPEIYWIQGPVLEERKMGHCGLSAKGGQKALLTGGYPTYLSQETFDMSSEAHDYVLNLIHKRWYHACGSYHGLLGEHFIVAGGLNEHLLAIDTVEIWNPLLHYWTEGPSLPESRSCGGMTILDGFPTILAGKSFLPQTSAMRLNVLEDMWDYWDFELKTGRNYPGLASIPETLFDRCLT